MLLLKFIHKVTDWCWLINILMVLLSVCLIKSMKRWIYQGYNRTMNFVCTNILKETGETTMQARFEFYAINATDVASMFDSNQLWEVFFPQTPLKTSNFLTWKASQKTFTHSFDVIRARNWMIYKKKFKTRLSLFLFF